ncbi:MAG TPA: anti-sigma factor antagonist [Gammaproteobacteria bacterium]|nr:anti-sigma factor antagonist [Gammaproteobacteria bacterium]
MNQPSLEKINAQHYALSGELNMHNVSQVSQDTMPLITAMSGEVTVNLSKVVRADSAGLALLIDWLRIARRRGFTLHFEQLPEQLMQIARVCELHSVLPIIH